MFLAIVMSFISSLPAHDKAIESTTAVEVVFWLWVLAYGLDEIDSASGDLGLTRESVRDYFKGIGNTLDAVIVSCSARHSLPGLSRLCAGGLKLSNFGCLAQQQPVALLVQIPACWQCSIEWER